MSSPKRRFFNYIMIRNSIYHQYLHALSLLYYFTTSPLCLVSSDKSSYFCFSFHFLVLYFLSLCLVVCYVVYAAPTVQWTKPRDCPLSYIFFPLISSLCLLAACHTYLFNMFQPAAGTVVRCYLIPAQCTLLNATSLKLHTRVRVHKLMPH
jgi:hypothetical protein